VVELLRDDEVPVAGSSSTINAGSTVNAGSNINQLTITLVEIDGFIRILRFCFSRTLKMPTSLAPPMLHA
jgi:hypothetical protein